MQTKKILKHLYSLESPDIKLGLKNFQALLDSIGNPEKSLKCIHVAGTNGKGSVCAMLQSVLMEAGYRVGMYTSPHLKKFNQRIRINEKLITDKEIVESFLRIKPFMSTQSFFEITTAMAFLYFREKNADFVVLEVGLGGRLDATNVAVPLVSVITNIGLEHTEILGNSIEKIAFEKSGIIKTKVPVVTAARGNSLKVIKKIAKKRKSPLILAKKYPKIGFKHLNGTFQQQNKDVALAAIDALKNFCKIKINESQIKNGLEKTRWPARLQFISRNVMVDAAHNPDGFRALKKELFIIKKNRKFQDLIFVTGIQSDKDHRSMLQIINPIISGIIFTKSGNEKASEPKELMDDLNKISKNKKMDKRIINNPKKALAYAKKIAGKNDLIVVAGSIYMVGEII